MIRVDGARKVVKGHGTECSALDKAVGADAACEHADWHNPRTRQAFGDRKKAPPEQGQLKATLGETMSPSLRGDPRHLGSLFFSQKSPEIRFFLNTFRGKYGFYSQGMGEKWRTLDVLRHQPITLFVFFATMVLTGAMMYDTPKGFFPIQDQGRRRDRRFWAFRPRCRRSSASS
jgi:hypothetical protein